MSIQTEPTKVIVYVVEGCYYPDGDFSASPQQYYAGTDLEAAKDTNYPASIGFDYIVLREWIDGYRVRSLESKRSNGFNQWETTFDRRRQLGNEMAQLKSKLATLQKEMSAIGMEEDL